MQTEKLDNSDGESLQLSQDDVELMTTAKPTRNIKLNALQILKDIKSLGCSKNELSAATYRIYLDLCEVRKYESVSYHHSTDLDHLYLKARRKQDDEQEILIPILATKTFSFKEIEKFQEAFSSGSIKLAVCDTSATITYYKLTKS